MWRPPNWDKLLEENNQWVDKNSVETGADIMLEAIHQEIKKLAPQKKGKLLIGVHSKFIEELIRE